ncbi:hypothetical protein [Ferrimonas marina]|uniref:Uncharacterized protein n=1 Tax=Ferrimonas marina TaxID=299255 RepID=A0A1M5YV55_9GAMM|nr:hypothetical protein [Ferrimonas marina]SHI15966.1 hypothetical protein SAMN02745129_4511 [Ferrimonas marina]
MTPEEQQKYFVLAERHHRLDRLYRGSQIGANKKFDRLCSIGFTLGGMAAVYVGRDNAAMTILFCALLVMAVLLGLALFRRVISHAKRPLNEELYIGYRMASDQGWQAGMDGIPERDCPYLESKTEQAEFARRWKVSHRRADQRRMESRLA